MQNMTTPASHCTCFINTAPYFSDKLRYGMYHSLPLHIYFFANVQTSFLVSCSWNSTGHYQRFVACGL